MPDEMQFLRKTIKHLQQQIFRLEQQLESGKFKKVRCRRLTIVDEHGREQVRIEAEQHGGSVAVIGKHGKPLVDLKVTPTGGAISVFNGDGQPQAGVEAGAAGTVDNPCVRISVTTEGGSLTIYDGDGGVRTVLP